MFASNRFVLVLLVLLLGIVSVLSVVMAGCQGTSKDSAAFQWQPLFGDMTKDTSMALAEVGPVTITERDLKSFTSLIPPKDRRKYEGADGERLALKHMINQTLMVLGAVETELYNDSEVASTLIAMRRNTLSYAMRNRGLLKGKEPSEDRQREFFMNNRDRYIHQGRVMARHVECMTEQDAELAYQRLAAKDPNDSFPYVVADLSINRESKENSGDLGWFAADSFVPYVRSPLDFSTAVVKLENGLHRPIQIADRWHVVEVTRRKDERPQTFSEAREKVKNDMMAHFQDELIQAYLSTSREKHGVTLMDRFAPGRGSTPEELFTRALALVDPEQKLDLLTLLQMDYPDHELADDALYMAAHAAVEAYMDRIAADRLLKLLLDEYPESELAEDALYLRKNIYRPEVWNPKTIEGALGDD